MYVTDNPSRDFDRWDERQQERLNSRPVCRGCGEPITDEVCLGWNGHKYHCDCREAWADDAAAECLEVTVNG